jgi:phosphoglycolate phosphatase
VYKKYLAEYNFDVVVGQRANKKTKPDPETTLEIIKNLSADKENTYFIGDGDTDVLASLNAGVNLITVTYGYRDKDILEKLGATCFVDTPKEIADIILGTANE